MNHKKPLFENYATPNISSTKQKMQIKKKRYLLASPKYVEISLPNQKYTIRLNRVEHAISPTPKVVHFTVRGAGQMDARDYADQCVRVVRSRSEPSSLRQNSPAISIKSVHVKSAKDLLGRAKPSRMSAQFHALYVSVYTINKNVCSGLCTPNALLLLYIRIQGVCALYQSNAKQRISL